MSQRFRLLIFALTVALAGSLSAVATSPVIAADPVERRVPSTVRVTPPINDFVAGERVRLRGRVRPGISRPVNLQKRTTAGWKRLQVSSTTADGRLMFEIQVNEYSTDFRVVAPQHVTGNHRYARARSNVVRVRVVANWVKMELSEKGVPRGERATAVATVSPARPGRVVVLREWDSRWVTVRRAVLTSAGVVRFRLDTDASARTLYRVTAKRHRGAYPRNSRPKWLDVVDVPRPASPTGLTAVAGDQSVSLTWDEVEGAERYAIRWQVGRRVQRRTVLGPRFDLWELTNGVPYTFTLTSVRGVLESHPQSVTVTPMAP